MHYAAVRHPGSRWPSLVLMALLSGAALAAGELEGRFAQELARADAGEAASQFAVAQMYELGVGVARDPAKALGWYRKAAQGGSPEAQYRIGEAYYWGRSLDRDYAQALSWFRRAVDQGYSPAAGYLSKMYALGQGVPRDKVQADQWAQRADTGYKREGQEELIALVREAAPEEAQPPGRTPATPPQAQATPPVPEAAASEAPPPPAGAGESTRERVERGNWSVRGRPAPWLPSALTQCRRDGGGLACQSKHLSGSQFLTAFTYRIVSTLGDFTQGGRFTTVYRRDILEVRSEGPGGYDEGDEPSRSGAQPMTVGLEPTERRLSCELTGADSLECLDEKGLRLSYERSP